MDGNSGDTATPATVSSGDKLTVTNHLNHTREVHISDREAIIFSPFETKEIDAAHRSKISGVGWTVKG